MLYICRSLDEAYQAPYKGMYNTSPYKGMYNTSPYKGMYNTSPYKGMYNTSPYKGMYKNLSSTLTWYSFLFTNFRNSKEMKYTLMDSLQWPHG